MKKFLAFSLVGAVLLTGCDDAGKAGMEGSPIWNLRNSSPQAKNAYFTQKCMKYGYRAGTDAMRDCVADERRNTSANRARALRY
tara:strand:- start:9 stop:260 length:252 start_codon:yes stop_codon:yes gene_type:complete